MLEALVSIDKAKLLAGLKISLSYKKDSLAFIALRKAPTTSSFMHVVNDKVPGKLIIVMASAKGVSGSNLPLFYIDFSKTLNFKKNEDYLLIKTCELMSENLKNIPCDYKLIHLQDQ